MPSARAIGQELAAKRNAVKEFLDAKKTADGYNLSETEIDEVRTKNTELTELGRKYEQALEIENVAADNEKSLRDMNAVVNGLDAPGGAGDGSHGQQKTLGQLFVESEQYKGFNPQANQGLFYEAKSISFKDIMTTSAGWAPDNPRTNVVVYAPQRRVMIPMLVPQGNTTLTSVEYMVELPPSYGADVRAENTPSGETTLTLQPASSPVMEISHHITVTDTQLEDVPQVMSLIDTRLTSGLEQKVESKLVNSNGAPTTFYGFLQVSGLQGQVQGTDPFFDTILKGVTKVRMSGDPETFGSAEPTAICLNPLDWQDIILTRTPDGLYILGNPGGPAPERIWGMVPTVTPVFQYKTGLIGDFWNCSHISNKKSITIDIGYNADDWKNHRKTIRGTTRLSLEIYRPGAFCKLTFAPTP